MNWTKERVKKFAAGLPIKYRDRVLNKLQSQGVSAAGREFFRCWRHVNNHTPSHPLISRGEQKTKSGSSIRVEELTRQGYSVNSIAKECGLSRRAVLAIRQRFHKKHPNVPMCTTMTSGRGQPPPERSQPQVHRFEIEVGLPWQRGNNNDWRNQIQKEHIRNYRQNKEFKGGLIEDFELTGCCSVRTTPYRIFINIKSVWGKTLDECKERAWLLAQEAALKLEKIYGFSYGDVIPLRFRGAHWALVNNKVAQQAIKARLEFMTIINGEKRMWTDKSPGKSLEFSRQEDAKLSYRDEEARVYAGLTNENIAKNLNNLISTVQNVVKMQEVTVRMLSPKIEENKITSSRPYYVG